MIKNRTIIEVEIKGREFRFECASESTWEDVLAALSAMHQFSNERIKVLTPSLPEIIESDLPTADIAA
jgi:hypothetical protein